VFPANERTSVTGGHANGQKARVGGKNRKEKGRAPGNIKPHQEKKNEPIQRILHGLERGGGKKRVPTGEKKGSIAQLNAGDSNPVGVPWQY